MKVLRPLVACMMICSGVVLAQDTSPKDVQEKRVQTRDSDVKEAPQLEQEIAAIKLAECRSEIELAKFAEERSKNEQVRKFAAMLVKDHSEACKELEKWAGHDRNTNEKVRVDADATTKEREAASDDKPAARLEVETKRGGVVGLDFNAGKKGSAPSGHTKWIAIHQEMSEKCLAASKKELNEKDGVEFDKCFMGMQIGAHQKTIIADEVFANYVSSESQKKLDQCRETATKHLEAAKTIYKDLEAKSVASATKR